MSWIALVLVLFRVVKDVVSVDWRYAKGDRTVCAARCCQSDSIRDRRAAKRRRLWWSWMVHFDNVCVCCNFFLFLFIQLLKWHRSFPAGASVKTGEFLYLVDNTTTGQTSGGKLNNLSQIFFFDDVSFIMRKRAQERGSLKTSLVSRQTFRWYREHKSVI